jgi:non-heme chloroperoxidase
MSTITTKDGTVICYKDWGSGPPVVFSHGWPLSADAWESQMVHLASRGYRCIAHDRRGHGRSSQPWNGNDMDTYADDLSELIEALDKIRAGVAADRSQFFKDLTAPFFGANRPGAKVSQGVRDAFWRLGMQGGLKNELDCIKAFSETDFTEDLKACDVPTLVVHGDDDQIVPIGPSARASAALLKHATLKVYAGGSHGLADTNKDQLNADLLAFLEM